MYGHALHARIRENNHGYRSDRTRTEYDDDVFLRLFSVSGGCKRRFQGKTVEGFSGAYNEIVPAIPPSLIDYQMHIPAYLHASEAVSLRFVQVSMDMAQLLCEECSLPSAHIRIRNFATNYILYLLDYIGPYLNISKEGRSSREDLYRRFVADIYNFCEREHDLQFYASRLCISKRYLSQIVREASGGDTPKQLIDKQLVFKIKSLLASTDSTLSQIACMLHFPDQSYLSRFFKRHASVYPSEYRKSLR